MTKLPLGLWVVPESNNDGREKLISKVTNFVSAVFDLRAVDMGGLVGDGRDNNAEHPSAHVVGLAMLPTML